MYSELETRVKEALKTPYDRKELIDIIIDYSGDEYENLADSWLVAKESDSQLASRVQNILDYYLED